MYEITSASGKVVGRASSQQRGSSVTMLLMRAERNSLVAFLGVDRPLESMEPSKDTSLAFTKAGSHIAADWTTVKATSVRINSTQLANCELTKGECMRANPDEEIGGFITYAHLQDHIKVNHPPRCSMCDLVCKSQRDLTSHIQANHGTLDVDDAKAHICPEPECGRAFTKKWNLKVHIQSTHNAKKYVCGDVDLGSLAGVEGWDGLDACGQALSTKGALVNHIRRVHMGLGQVRSATKKNQRSDLMRRNLMKLTGMGYEDERYIACVIPSCKVRFNRVYDLRIHLVSHHQLSVEDAEEAVVIYEEKAGSMGYVNEESLPHDLMYDIDPRDWHMMDPGSRETDLMENGTFWEDEEEEAERLGKVENNSWLGDEREMRMLIDDEQSEIHADPETLAAIDPSLQ
ncbi:MAG: hypothetical protein Q9194_000316 [Teloschistes cf. exilis]